jgi:hypothetical protein
MLPIVVNISEKGVPTMKALSVKTRPTSRIKIKEFREWIKNELQR